ncbi:pimeloyl-ACP methyl ester carboxylesterase [Caulobacter ginsengisoli]|uniref:Pimeloyl-ACP methyl ester carboxylesterase n=1 Tax=Caulobacter ginsengisoli TaxID=400775 RepID=A0ABU0IVU0_9CAUL|nr:alpha/beta hydrolase [Caulobacter ginsengisoli]MDQ0466129.1 pimeloyl-ACP methyl ester carboxylesterase [Caulobacter ginsengisoli]
MSDDDLQIFAAQGATLPPPDAEGHVEHDGARIWFASYGDGPPVILLHGGLGHSGNFAHQIPVLVEASRRVIVVDSRGHGRSTRDERPYSYDLMAADLVAVMDHLGIDRAPLVGWSDGACIALALARQAPERVAGVFFFGCNVDPSGTLELDESNPLLGRCFSRHAKDYAALSATPDDFKPFVDAVSRMQATQPNYGAADLARIAVPVRIVQAEHDEFIRPEHARYLAASIPGASFQMLSGASHFAPLQRPGLFNAAVLDFLSASGRL